jgi:alpha-glucosidase (family GH31 glycosyl hydrolase)
VSVLSDRLIRVEKAQNGAFLDKATQTVINRNISQPEFSVADEGKKTVITTEAVKFVIDKKKLWVACEIDGKTVRPSAKGNLGGTVRTLDMNFGKADLGAGLMSREGVSVIDDGASFVLEEDGSVSPRPKGAVDFYVFAFGHDYLGALRAFYSLTGFTPMLPKYALGNWWSRYHAYSDKEYLALMDEFEKKNIPFTVATIDMDWHYVKDVPKDAKAKSMQGRGWTGYSFDKKLFPDHKSFLAQLKERGLAVTMNLHPRDGVRYFEDMYPQMAEACGIDPKTKKPVEFDLTDEKFLNAYFDILHHPYEDDGVDFWWIDWQQGTKSKIKGLDPLWLLNHYHFLDSARNGKTPLILSRYAGLGSHRYPLGFSGDTVVCWRSLRFQPYFTATASNVGYTWWSHDIGGHQLSRGNSELYLRWLQLGVFSPINRLHSTKIGISKEPWLYPEVESVAEDFLRLRHRLLPYLYTANVRTAKEGIPLVMPLYYISDTPEAYDERYKTEYAFGSEMLVAPIVGKAGADGKAEREVWLPEGEWTDFFTGEKYQGAKAYVIKRDFSSIPVFVKKGGVVPLLAERKGNSQKFDWLEVRVYSGSNKYVMYDEKGQIEFSVTEKGESLLFDIKPSSDCQTERIKIVFCDAESDEITVNGYDAPSGSVAEIDCKRTKIVLKNVKRK